MLVKYDSYGYDGGEIMFLMVIICYYHSGQKSWLIYWNRGTWGHGGWGLSWDKPSINCWFNRYLVGAWATPLKNMSQLGLLFPISAKHMVSSWLHRDYGTSTKIHRILRLQWDWTSMGLIWSKYCSYGRQEKNMMVVIFGILHNNGMSYSEQKNGCLPTTLTRYYNGITWLRPATLC